MTFLGFAGKLALILAATWVFGAVAEIGVDEPPPPPPMDEYTINEEQRAHRTGSNDCMTLKECMKSCPIGYLKVGTNCECICRKNGTFEGDIAVDEKSYRYLLKQYGVCDTTSDERQVKGGMADTSRQWPKSGSYVVIPITFASTVSSTKQKNIRMATEIYHQRTCIRFVTRTNQNDYIEFHGTGGCASYVGKTGGKQPVWIGTNCDNGLGTILHELMHALGFWHEQSRGDRDSYVSIQFENIVAGADNNFKKQDTSQWNSYGSPYDYGSVMHYGGYFFSKDRNNLPTIINRQTGKPVVHQRNGFSDEDVKQINAKYQCSGSATTTTTRPTTATTRPTTAVCVDRSSNCKSYADQGLCRTNEHVKNTLCPRLCHGCTGVVTATPTTTTTATTTTKPVTTATSSGSCSDVSQHCGYWQKKGYCTKQYVSYMKKNCKKSCNLCGGVTTVASTSTTVPASACKDKYSSCNFWEGKGYCKARFVDFMKKNCKASCNLCSSGTTTVAACKDGHSSCQVWADRKYCQVSAYKSYMLKHCKKACMVCNNGQSVTTTTVANAVVTQGASYTGGCGVPAVSLLYRIVGGKAATYKASPWLASLRQKNDLDICGASLISNRYLVTAAHCFGGLTNPNPSNYYLFLGKYHRGTTKDAGQVKVYIESIKIHPRYNHDFSDNDIAIIKLTSPVTYNEYIRPICLPQRYEEPVSGTIGLVTGWGDTLGSDNNDKDRVLLQVDVEIIETRVCNEWLGLYKNRTQVTQEMFCAGHESGGKDACQGDSGGPLVQQRGSNTHVLKGIVSWGHGCARKRKPGVYTKVSYMVDWIYANTQ